MFGINIAEETANGWFGQSKTSAILSTTILFIVLMSVIALIFLIAINILGETNVSQTTVPTTPTPVTAGTIQVPEGPKIKVIFNGPPELTANWEKIGMLDSFQVQLIGTLKNVSEQSVKFSEIGFFFDSQQIGYIPGLTLKPGETMKILRAFPYAENAKVLEVKIKGFEAIGGPTATPEPATTTQTETEIFGSSFTKEVLKNPQSPGEVEAAFWFFCSEKKHDEAAKLLTQERLQFIESKGGLEWYGELLLKGRQLERIEFWRVDIDADENRASIDDIIMYFSNEAKETYKGSNSLIEEVDGWKKNR